MSETRDDRWLEGSLLGSLLFLGYREMGSISFPIRLLLDGPNNRAARRAA